MDTALLPVITDPLVLANQVYLRCSDVTRLVRPPSPPLLMTAAGRAAATFGLYRHLDGEPHGGGVLAVTLDLGAPWAGSEEAEVLAGPQIQDLASPQHLAGDVRLFLGDRECAVAALPAGARPIVPLSAWLEMNEASVLRSSIDEPQGAPGQGEGPLYATAQGQIACSRAL